MADAYNIIGYTQVTQALAANTPAQTAAKLAAWATYLVWCNEGDCFVKLDPTDAATGLTVNNGFPIYQGVAVELRVVSDQDHYLGGLCSGAATLRYHRIR